MAAKTYSIGKTYVGNQGNDKLLTVDAWQAFHLHPNNSPQP